MIILHFAQVTRKLHSTYAPCVMLTELLATRAVSYGDNFSFCTHRMNNAIIMHGLGRAITDPPLIVVEKEVGLIYTLQVLLCSSLSGYHGIITI